MARQPTQRLWFPKDRWSLIVSGEKTTQRYPLEPPPKLFDHTTWKWRGAAWLRDAVTCDIGLLCDFVRLGCCHVSCRGSAGCVVIIEKIHGERLQGIDWESLNREGFVNEDEFFASWDHVWRGTPYAAKHDPWVAVTKWRLATRERDGVSGRPAVGGRPRKNGASHERKYT